MKEFLLVTLLVAAVACEAPAPYPPSGWKPDGPAFDLPKPQKQEYLPPVDPRRPNNNDDVDVSVQGLPTQEQQPIFQLSPINGQQYNGPSVNADIRNLDPSFKQIQYQQQLQNAQIFARQKEFDAQVKTPNNGLPNRQSPRQFVTEPTTTEKPRSRNAEPTTERFNLNQGEQLDNPDDKKEKVSVEVTKQNVQEYPAELFLNPLSQLNLQPQFVPLQQFGQLRAPLYYQQIQSSDQGFNGPAHLAALPSVLAQKQLLEQQNSFAQNPIVVQQEPALQNQPIQYQPQLQYPAQPVVLQPQPVQPNQYPQPQFQANPQLQPEADAETIPTDTQSQYPQTQTVTLTPNQAQPNFIQPNQFVQPNAFAVQPNQFFQPQFAQPAPVQPNQFAQSNQIQPQFIQPAQLQPDQLQPQFIQQAQLQPQFVQQQLQPQFVQPEQYHPQYVQTQLQPNQDSETINPQYYQPQVVQLEQGQNQDALQSGLNDPQDNNLDEEIDEGNKATAVATAFGSRTQPRVFSGYGAPVPTYQTTTEAAQEENVTEDGPAISQATAVASGKRKSAKLRNRRVRPVFTVDRSGHLVLAQDN